MAKVTIQSSGQSFDVRPSQTVLEAAIAAGINIPYGCRNGTCGSCKGQVLNGKVMHDDYMGSAMSDAELAAGNALFCCARPLEDLVIQCRVSETEIRPRILPARVQKLEKLADDVMVMFLQLPANQSLEFKAGQYIEFLLQDGKRRAFSLANAPHDAAAIELHLRHVDGGQFTTHVFNELQEKAIMRIEAPLGSFYLREESDKPIIFAATGTGFAPIKGIIEHMFHQGIQREVLLYRGARTLDDMYMHDLCERWAAHMPNLTYIPVLSKADDNWQGKRGYVQQAIVDDVENLAAYQAYVCGLPDMVNDAQKVFIENGLAEDEIFSDAFTFAPR